MVDSIKIRELRKAYEEAERKADLAHIEADQAIGKASRLDDECAAAFDALDEAICEGEDL
jgi:hypothetical protein